MTIIIGGTAASTHPLLSGKDFPFLWLSNDSLTPLANFTGLESYSSFGKAGDGVYGTPVEVANKTFNYLVVGFSATNTYDVELTVDDSVVYELTGVQSTTNEAGLLIIGQVAEQVTSGSTLISAHMNPFSGTISVRSNCSTGPNRDMRVYYA